MKIQPQPITRKAFAPFGEVIEPTGAEHFAINDGTSERFHDLCNIDLSEAGGRPGISIFRAGPRTLPLKIDMLERHPLSSQAFIPLAQQDFLVVVAAACDAPTPASIHAFSLTSGQGVNFSRGTWHFPLIAPEGGDFAIFDRIAEDENCDITQFTDEILLAPK